MEQGNATEILDVDTMTWRTGPDFPTYDSQYRTYYGETLQYKNSFLAIGGKAQGYGEGTEIWYYNPESSTWDLKAKLVQRRHWLTAIALPENICG